MVTRQAAQAFSFFKKVDQMYREYCYAHYREFGSSFSGPLVEKYISSKG